jgi:catechol 2,3-dioxygenase-like lactoylglutathione lyase family enzyme
MAQATKQKSKDLFKLDESFSSYSIDDVKAAKDFYVETLGIKVTEEKEGGLGLKLGDTQLYLYPKEDHEPASFTVLNIAVTDIDAAVAELSSRGVEFESYAGDIETDENGIFRGGDKGNGPNIAWFKDPSGNILSVIEKK